ncbi:MAG: hypothetical protein M3273_02690 [Actinomycetota bacterium]|nr:hypothetical protein [Actinomycetota bacterium]
MTKAVVLVLVLVVLGAVGNISAVDFPTGAGERYISGLATSGTILATFSNVP